VGIDRIDSTKRQYCLQNGSKIGKVESVNLVWRAGNFP
jgi:hypothetical protein